jgi:hypothetical protein
VVVDVKVVVGTRDMTTKQDMSFIKQFSADIKLVPLEDVPVTGKIYLKSKSY